MWNLTGEGLPSEIKQPVRGLPLFTLITSDKVANSKNSLFTGDSSDSDEVIEQPELSLESKGFIYTYQDTLSFPAYTNQTASVVTTPDNYFSLGGITILYTTAQVDHASLDIEGEEEIYSSDIEEIRATAEYLVYPTKHFKSVTEVYSEGLKFIGSDLLFDPSTQILSLVGCSLGCRPRIEDPLSVTTIKGLVNPDYTMYKALVFDFSDPAWGAIQSIDFLDWQNKTFYKAYTISNYGLMYDANTKKALCTWQ